LISRQENTQDHRRGLRRAEYDDEREPAMREHLQASSPLTPLQRNSFVMYAGKYLLWLVNSA
jgi:hypothetical protein